MLGILVIALNAVNENSGHFPILPAEVVVTWVLAKTQVHLRTLLQFLHWKNSHNTEDLVQKGCT